MNSSGCIVWGKKSGGKPVVRHAFSAFEEASFPTGKCLSVFCLFCNKNKENPVKSNDFTEFCLLLPKKIQPGKPCGSMDSGFCATCVFVFLRFFQAISEPPYDILTKPCANRGEKRAVRQHSPLSYFSLMICSYSMAYFFSITMLLW